VPSFGPPTRQYIVWLLVPLMVFSLVRIKRDELRDGLRRLDLLGAGLAFLYLVVPLVMWGAGLAAGLSPELLFGVTLAALSPTIVLAPFFTDMIGGNRVLAAMISVVSTLLSPLLIPLLLVAMVGRTVAVPVGTIALNAGALVGLPVLIALVLRKARPSLRDEPIPGERFVTAVIFFFFMWGVIASSLGGINLFSIPLLVALALLQEYAFFFGLRWALGRMAARGVISAGNAKALALCIGIKNGALTAGIALTFSATVAMSSGLITLVSAPLFVMFGVFREKI
jgi:BASS family bile acid:Na+ symporter